MHFPYQGITQSKHVFLFEIRKFFLNFKFEGFFSKNFDFFWNLKFFLKYQIWGVFLENFDFFLEIWNLFFEIWNLKFFRKILIFFFEIWLCLSMVNSKCHPSISWIYMYSYRACEQWSGETGPECGTSRCRSAFAPCRNGEPTGAASSRSTRRVCSAPSVGRWKKWWTRRSTATEFPRHSLGEHCQRKEKKKENTRAITRPWFE